MDVTKFINSLDIFDDDSAEPNLHFKSTAALFIAVGLMFFPASALRWDGSIRSPLEKEPLTKIEKARLEPNAVLNRALRISAALLGLGLATYGALLDHKDLQKEPLRVKKKEAQTILQDEILNVKIIEMLPKNPDEEEPQKALPPNLQSIFDMMGKNKGETGDDLQAVAASKFTVSSQGAATKPVTVAEGMKARNVEINRAIAHVEKPVPAGEEKDPDRWKVFERIGQNILDGMIITEKSILIASGTGTGKTTTEQHLLQGLIQNYPTTKFYALLQKNDQLIGVDEDRRYVFDNALLNQYLAQGKPEEDEEVITLFDVLAPLFIVYGEFARRKALPATEREYLKETEPVRLILGDWFATYQELSRLDKKDKDQTMSMIRQIIAVGRDGGVGLIVDSQSAALVSLGMAEDASIRESLDIYSQGFVRRVKGQERGEVRTMMQVINNNSMVSKEDREGLTKAYLLLTNAIQTGEVNSPIIFTTVGSVPTIGIVPNLSHMTVRDSERTVTAKVEQIPEVIEAIPEVVNNPTPITMADIALNIIAKATQPCSFEAIRTSRDWTDKRPKSAELRDALDLLVSQEKIEGNEDDGYVS